MDFLSYQIFILYYNIKHNTTQHVIQENLTKKYRISAACKEFKVEQVSKTRPNIELKELDIIITNVLCYI